MTLTRAVQRMPADVAKALSARGVRGDYDARPAYQRNDYLAWIGRSKRPETRARRLEQLLSELEKGGIYMGMKHAGSKKPR